MPDSMVITGTSKGIGRYLTAYYLSKGYKVSGCSRAPSDFSHDKYKHYELDVADERAVAKMIADIRKREGGIDVLINNAAIASMNHFLTTPGKTIENIFRTNVLGSFIFAREAAKVMMKARRGCIVNFSTVAVPLRLEGEVAYAASKAAIVNFTETIARELAPFGITVNAVGPTPIHTDLIKAVPKDKIQNLIERQAIKRFAEFSDVANVIDFFIDERSKFITAQVIYLGGVYG